MKLHVTSDRTIDWVSCLPPSALWVAGH